MRRRTLVLAAGAALPLLAAAACDQRQQLPAGSYAGTFGGRQAIRLDIGGDVRVNNVKAKFVGTGVIRLDEGAFGKVDIDCRPTNDKADELACTATGAAGMKTSFPLMRL